MKKRRDSIDLMKFSASILIFLMHSKIFPNMAWADDALQIAARWGVPFFFISSSYFLFGKRNGEMKNAVVMYTRRIALLYGVWFLFNLPGMIYDYCLGRDPLDIRTWLLMFKSMILTSTFKGSWFLLSSVFSAWAVYALSKKCSARAIIVLTLPLYLCCAASSVYGGLLPEGAAVVFSTLFFPTNIAGGCFYFALGKYAAENETALLRRIPRKKAIVLALVFYLAYVAEVLFAKRGGFLNMTDVALSIAPAAFFLFLFCLQWHAAIPCHLQLRKMSVVIYCCQSNLLHVSDMLSHILGISFPVSMAGQIMAVFVLAAAVLLLEANSRWKWVRYLT